MRALLVMIFTLLWTPANAQVTDPVMRLPNKGVINMQTPFDLNLFSLDGRYEHILTMTRTSDGAALQFQTRNRPTAVISIPALDLGEYSFELSRKDTGTRVKTFEATLRVVDPVAEAQAAKDQKRKTAEKAAERQAQKTQNQADTERRWLTAKGFPEAANPNHVKKAVENEFNLQVFGPYCRRGARHLQNARFSASWKNNACRFTSLGVQDAIVQSFKSTRLHSCKGNTCRYYVYLQCAFKGYLNAQWCNHIRPNDIIAYADVSFAQGRVTNMDVKPWGFLQ